MDSDLQFIDDLMDFLFLVLCATTAYKKLNKQKRRFCRRDVSLERTLNDFFSQTFNTMKHNNPEKFHEATRMSPSLFDHLHTLLKDKLEKYSARAFSTECRLFLTLTYLAHGTNKKKLSLSFKISVGTVRKIVAETCSVIWDGLNETYLPIPNEKTWENIAEGFSNMWNLPNCVGVIDGKQVAFTCPPTPGAKLSINKDACTIVVLALCDANYNFTAVDVGSCGGQNNEGTFTSADVAKRLHAKTSCFPPDAKLPNSSTKLPYYFVGNIMFPLKNYLMRPYPGLLLSEERQNFNKRLSKANNVIENAFGILTARWKVLRSTLHMWPQTAEKIVRATFVLHNFVKMNDEFYCSPNFVDNEENGVVNAGLWRLDDKPLKKLARFSSNNSTRTALQIRDTLSAYLYTQT